MAYNKAKAERIWKRWKEIEEYKLRQLNASDEMIAKLRIYDWAMFNAEKRFRQREITSSISFENTSSQPDSEYIKTVKTIIVAGK